MQKLSLAFLVLALALCSCLPRQCADGTLSNSPTCVVKRDQTFSPSHRILPISSFVMVHSTVTFKPKKCTARTKKKKKKCSKKEIKEGSTTLIKMRPVFRGSGIVIKVLNNKTYILTAKHVCTREKNTKLTKKINEKEPSTLVEWDVEQTITSNVVGQDGISRKSKAMIIHEKKDVCIMVSPGDWGIPVPIAKHSPEIGEKVFNIAAPLGVFEPGKTTLVFSGHAAGIDSDGDAYFTIPARPGSSGSAVLNNRGEIVAIIFAANAAIENFALAVPLKNIKEVEAALFDQVVNDSD